MISCLHRDIACIYAPAFRNRLPLSQLQPQCFTNHLPNRSPQLLRAFRLAVSARRTESLHASRAAYLRSSRQVLAVLRPASARRLPFQASTSALPAHQYIIPTATRHGYCNTSLRFPKRHSSPYKLYRPGHERTPREPPPERPAPTLGDRLDEPEQEEQDVARLHGDTERDPRTNTNDVAVAIRTNEPRRSQHKLSHPALAAA